VTLGRGLAGAGRAKGGRRIVDGDDAFGAKAVVSLNKLVFLRLGLIELPECRLVDKGEMRVVERVFLSNGP
jgi:hypothetical protein